jgi:hypothetical protein
MFNQRQLTWSHNKSSILAVLCNAGARLFYRSERKTAILSQLSQPSSRFHFVCFLWHMKKERNNDCWLLQHREAKDLSSTTNYSYGKSQRVAA